MQRQQIQKLTFQKLGVASIGRVFLPVKCGKVSTHACVPGAELSQPVADTPGSTATPIQTRGLCGRTYLA